MEQSFCLFVFYETPAFFWCNVCQGSAPIFIFYKFVSTLYPVSQLRKCNFVLDVNSFTINFRRLKTNYPATTHFLNVSQSIMNCLVEKLATLNNNDCIFQINIREICDKILKISNHKQMCVSVCTWQK